MFIELRKLFTSNHRGNVSLCYVGLIDFKVLTFSKDSFVTNDMIFIE